MDEKDPQQPYRGPYREPAQNREEPAEVEGHTFREPGTYRDAEGLADDDGPDVEGHRYRT